MKYELGGKIMKKFIGLRTKCYSYLIEDDSEYKNAKGTKKCVIKRKLKFQDHKNCLKASQIINKVNYLEKKKINVDCVNPIQDGGVKKASLLVFPL